METKPVSTSSLSDTHSLIYARKRRPSSGSSGPGGARVCGAPHKAATILALLQSPPSRTLHRPPPAIISRPQGARAPKSPPAAGRARERAQAPAARRGRLPFVHPSRLSRAFADRTRAAASAPPPPHPNPSHDAPAPHLCRAGGQLAARAALGSLCPSAASTSARRPRPGSHANARDLRPPASRRSDITPTRRTTALECVLGRSAGAAAAEPLRLTHSPHACTSAAAPRAGMLPARPPSLTASPAALHASPLSPLTCRLASASRSRCASASASASRASMSASPAAARGATRRAAPRRAAGSGARRRDGGECAARVAAIAAVAAAGRRARDLL